MGKYFFIIAIIISNSISASSDSTSIKNNCIIVLAEQIGNAVPQKLVELVINDSLLVRMMFNEYVELDIPLNHIPIRFENGIAYYIDLKELKSAVVLIFNGNRISQIKTIDYLDAERIILTRKLQKKSCENFFGTFKINEE